jgi:hypothetical protein
MSVVVKQEPDVLTVTQSYGGRYKVIMLLVILLLGAPIPACLLYYYGLNASLVCGREAGAGVVCTDRVSWLGVSRSVTRYEHVQRAAVHLTTENKKNYRDLELVTATGPVVFGSDDHNGFAAAVDRINAFIQNPDAPRPAVSRPFDRTEVMTWGGLLLVMVFLGLVMLMWPGKVTVFDAGRGRVWLNSQGLLGLASRTLPLSAVINVYATPESKAHVYLTTANERRLVCRCDESAMLTFTVGASEVVQSVMDWLAPYQKAAHPRYSAPAAADLVEVLDPTLAYLLGYSRSGAALTQGTRTYLRLDVLGGIPWHQRAIRESLAGMKAAESPLDRALALLAFQELIAMCHVDVHAALKAASAQQREAIDTLLRRPERPFRPG